MIKIFKNLSNKIHEMFSGKKEGFSDEDKPTGIAKYLLISAVVFAIISLILDILKYTPVYENKFMKKIIDINYYLLYGLGALGKIAGGILLIMLFRNDKSFIGKYLMIVVPIILFISFIFDIIMLTPLMQNSYVNQIVTLNKDASIYALMILKLLLPGFLMINL